MGRQAKRDTACKAAPHGGTEVHSASIATRIRVGIGGWDYAPWRGSFFPKGLKHADELGYASRQLTSIEINGTFYRQQTRETFAKWAAETPEDFVFSVKAHRAATMTKDAAKASDAVQRFVESGIDALGAKLGPLLWQLPPRRKLDLAAMQAFVAMLPAKSGACVLRHAIEARDPSFRDPAYLALLRQHGVAQVIVDSDKQELAGDLTAKFVYARLQRNAAAEPDGYVAAALDDWASRAQRWRTGRLVSDMPSIVEETGEPPPRDCFVYFISGDKERAPDAARALLRRLDGS